MVIYLLIWVFIRLTKEEVQAMNKNGVSVSKIVERLDLKVFTENIDLKKRKIKRSDINRPALQLAGFFVHFASSRVQVIGNVE